MGRKGSAALYKSGICLAVLVLDAIVDDDDSCRNCCPLSMIQELGDIERVFRGTLKSRLGF